MASSSWKVQSQFVRIALMNGRRPVRIIIVTATCLCALIEWLLWELIRLPYCPPYDMGTLLGTEKNLVLYLMVVLSVLWLLMLCFFAMTRRFTIKDYLGFTALIAILITVFNYLITHPYWPVSPTPIG